jgi:hypothetical protein
VLDQTTLIVFGFESPPDRQGQARLVSHKSNVRSTFAPQTLTRAFSSLRSPPARSAAVFRLQLLNYFCASRKLLIASSRAHRCLILCPG